MRTVGKDGDDFEVEDDVEKDFRTLDILQSPLIQRMRIVAKTNNAIAVILKTVMILFHGILVVLLNGHMTNNATFIIQKCIVLKI